MEWWRVGVLEYWSIGAMKAAEDWLRRALPYREVDAHGLVGRDSVEPISANSRSVLEYASPLALLPLAQNNNAPREYRMGRWSNRGNETAVPAIITPLPTTPLRTSAGQRAAKKWQPSDSALKFNMLSLFYA